MAKEADTQRAIDLASAAGEVAAWTRGLIEADTAHCKNIAQRYLRLALVQWQMVCEGRIAADSNGLDFFAKEHSLL